MIVKRNPILVLIFNFITFGIYGLVWTVKTKDEMNSLGANVPTAWLLIVPIANIYFVYKYAEAFSNYIKNDNNTILWLFVIFLTGPLSMPIYQMGFNHRADSVNQSSADTIPQNTGTVTA